MKVAFDFDSTLSEKRVQKYAKELVERGIEVWIVTSRPDVYVGNWTNYQPDNDDLYAVAKEVGIKPEHIHFTCYELKSNFITGKGFLFHLDDDEVELRAIFESKDKCKPYHVYHDEWRESCEKILKQNTNS